MGSHLSLKRLPALDGQHFVEAAAQRLFLAGELGAEDARVGLGEVERHLLELIPGLRRLRDAQVGAVVHAGDVEVARHDPDVAVGLGRIHQAGDEVLQILGAEVIVDRLEAVELDVLREEAGVIPAHIVVHRAGGHVLDQALVGLEAVALEDELDLGAGLLFPRGDQLVQLVVVGAADGVHLQRLAVERLADHRGSRRGCGRRLGRRCCGRGRGRRGGRGWRRARRRLRPRRRPGRLRGRKLRRVIFFSSDMGATPPEMSVKWLVERWLSSWTMV